MLLDLFPTHNRHTNEHPMNQIVHVDQHAIKRNAKHGIDDPVFTTKTYKSNDKSRSVEIVAPDGTVVGRFVYSPNPLSCGARAWFELNTDSGYECVPVGEA